MDGDGRGSRFRGENRLENDVADAPVVLYEERDGLAIITLNRPEKMNTLNNDVIRGSRTGSTGRRHRPRSRR